jgi:RNA polymerase sigma-70 factor, ECF subfamily
MTFNSPSEILSLIQKNDGLAKKQLFELFYGKMATIALRYCKNQNQADEALNEALNNCVNKLQHPNQAQAIDLDVFIEKEFIIACVAYVKNIRSEYYVASTVYASETSASNYDLFANNELVDFNKTDSTTFIKALQQLVPSQRLVFNLHVIDGYTLQDAAALLESSEQTVKSNLEKARFNLQKNIQKCLNNVKYEQSL